MKCHWVTECTRLFRSLYHTFLHVLIFKNAGVWIFCVDLFSWMKEILRQNTPRNLEQYFDFVFYVQCIFAKKLNICQIENLIFAKNIVTWEKVVRISILFGGGASSGLVLISKTIFTQTLNFWRIPPSPPPTDTPRSIASHHHVKTVSPLL